MNNIETTFKLRAMEAVQKMEYAIGLGQSSFEGTSTFSSNAPEGLTLDSLKEAINLLKESDILAQKRLITLLSSMGFNVAITEYGEQSMVFLPKDYSEAMKEIYEERKLK